MFNIHIFLRSYSDSCLFASTDLARQVYGNCIINCPEPKVLPNSNISCPYVFLSDEIFGLSYHLMKPYKKNQEESNISHLVFNYRLARARCLIEQAFGHLVNRWRILLGKLPFSLEAADFIVGSCILARIFF